MAPLRWGIAATGEISFDFANALTTLPASDHQLVAVAARSAKKAEEFAKKFDIPAFYEGYDKMMLDEDVDVVYVGSIVATHFEISMQALEAGKHVLCEKPLCVNEKQVKKLVETAKEKNVFFMEAVWSRFFESFQLLRKRIDDGDLGEIKEIEVEFGFELPNAERLYLKSGGGTILDLGVYPIHLSLWVFRDEPSKVIAFGKLNDDGIDLEVTGELKFPSGGITKFKQSCLRSLSNVATIKGTKGNFVMHDFWCSTAVEDVDGSKKTWELPRGRYDFMLKNSSGLRFEAEETRLCINAGLIESTTVPHSESIRLARVEDKLRKLVGVKFDEDALEY